MRTSASVSTLMRGSTMPQTRVELVGGAPLQCAPTMGAATAGGASGYVRGAGGWKMAGHRQTPVTQPAQ